MILKKLRLTNFRTYKELELEFNKGVNVISGLNGVGKTNIVEAIHYLSFARSFRTLDSGELITKGQDEALIKAEVIQGEKTKRINAYITKNAKKISCNNKPVSKLSQLARLVNVLIFEPKDAFMFYEPPIIRRNFFDIVISKSSTSYLEALIRFKKLLKERNKILKKPDVDLNQLDVVTSLLIEEEELIIKHRSLSVSKVNELISKIYNSITRRKSVIQVEYTPFVKLDSDFKSNAKKIYSEAIELDIKNKSTSHGPHRDDYVLLMDGHEVSNHCSQGENRLCALSLKLAPYFFEECNEEKPIVVLDDVLSELDENNQESLLEFVSRMEQTFITTTNKPNNISSCYEVKNQRVFRRIT